MGKVCCLATTAHTTTRNCCVNVGSVLPKNFVDVICSLFHSYAIYWSPFGAGWHLIKTFGRLPENQRACSLISSE